MKACPKCQVSVSDTAKFCVKCGFNIKKFEEENAARECFCPECGTKFSGGTFCPECGYDASGDLIGIVSDAAVVTPAPSFDFCAEVDFSAMSEEAQNQLYRKEGFVVENGILTGYTGKKRIITIPGTIDEIYDGAFNGNAIISYVEIGKGVRVIGKKAFANCETLVKVSIPDSVEKIFDDAFADTHLETLIVSSCDRSVLNKFISRQAKEYLDTHSLDRHLTTQSGNVEVNILELEKDAQQAVETAAKEAEKKRKAEEAKARRRYLANFEIIDGKLIKYKGDDAHVHIPEGVKTIGKSAFAYNRSLISVDIPDSVDHIDDFAFYECRTLAEVKIPDSVLKIGSEAFAYCFGIKQITVPESVNVIDCFAFDHWQSDQKIRIPKRLAGCLLDRYGDIVLY